MSVENNTKESFKNKWDKNPNLAFNETLNPDSEILKWILERNNFKNVQDLKDFLKGKKRILDGGCGNGRVTALLRECSNPEETEIVGIDLVASPVAKENLAKYQNVSFYEKDLMQDLSDLGKFDYIYCQEVLHHTANPEKSFRNLVSILEKDGIIAIYVYKKKAPIREFTDDYIRDIISKFGYEDSMKVCHQITELSKVLSEQKIKIKVPSVDILEIKEGEYDIQRFIYHFFMKCFWCNDFSFEDNSVINYDWYHPQLCSKHTLKEVKEWFKAAGLTVLGENVDFYGITVRGIKSKN